MPATPYIERRGEQQIVNLDLLVTNHSAQGYRLVAVQMSVFDRNRRLVLKRELNENGHPPALEIVGQRILPATSTIDLYQPFPWFDPWVELRSLRFTLLFAKQGHSSSAVALTSDESVSMDVYPRPYSPAAYSLPLKGRVLVHDGHDLFSHHRRFNLAADSGAELTRRVSPNLYAYDLMATRPDGSLYEGDLSRKENWFSYAAPIYAPEQGTVVHAVSNVPENTLDGDGNVQIPPLAAQLDPIGMGNAIALRHPDGRVSWLLHMQPGSLAVKQGSQVRSGQYLGRVGFSGDSLFPHLHYTVTDKATYPAQGVPSYFKYFTRLLGSKCRKVSRGQIDTGDVIQNGLEPCPARD